MSEDNKPTVPWWVDQAGVFRCCTQTAHQHGPGGEDRQKLPCEHCENAMVWLDGIRTWRGKRWVESSGGEGDGDGADSDGGRPQP